MIDVQHNNNSNATVGTINIRMSVSDPETVAELSRHSEGTDRDRFALAALRVGVLALRQASGSVDADSVRREGERLMSSVRDTLKDHATNTLRGVAESLRKYFDANDGELPQRLNRLVSQNGELEQLLTRHIGTDGSTLAGTLEKHVGEESALLKMLSPEQSNGVLCLLKQTVEASLEQQRKTILGQFSLDDKESALSRLVKELTDGNGQLREELAEDVESVRKEFSLDNEDGALFRLVRRVEDANKAIMSEFSHDNEHSAINRMSSLLEKTHASIRDSLTLDRDDSPLARLRTELKKTIDSMSESNAKFQSDVRDALTELKAKREEAERSTRHGLSYEKELGEFLQVEARRLNDVHEDTTASAGAISRCKVGDHVIELGPDSAAPGSRVVFEAKGNKTYDVAKTLAELREARENRKASVGMMVFTPAAAPDGLEVINRWGDDIVVVWDAENADTDIYLRAAISLARSMVVAGRKAEDSTAADFAEMEAAVNEVLRNAELLDGIQTMATTVKNNGEKIVKKAEKLKGCLETQIERIQSHLTNAAATA